MPNPRETEDHVPMAESVAGTPADVTTDHVPQAAPRAGVTDPVTAGTYRIVRKLGEGGMGAVFLAEQRNPQRPVALKVIRPDRVSPRMLMRFRLESQILAWLRHPAVAQVYESGEVDGPHGKQPFYAMEYVEGEPLDEYADGRGLDDRGRMELFAAVCDGVEAAHRRGITHRDLKPANILVTDDGQPKILDFGVARVSDPDAAPDADQTAQGQVIGTLNYMSPEQAAGDQAAIDTRADVYSLGVILYELLSGRLPLNMKGKPLPVAVREIATAEPPPLSAHDRRFRGDVTAIAAKALAKDPRERYQSAADLAADVRRHLADLPVQARPPGALVAFRKFARRNKAVVAAVAFAAFALIAGAGAATAGLIEARAAAKQAEDEAGKARQAEREERKAKEEEAKAKAQAQAELAPRTFTIGRLQQRQGKYKDALASFRKARELGFADETEYLLATLDCQIGAAQVKEARETAAALAARKNWGKHKAEVLLVLADASFTFGTKFGAEPEELVMQALLAGLPPAKASYARAIISTNIADMERHLTDSVRLDPANPDGAVLLVMCQIVLGKLNDARVTLGRYEAMQPGTLGTRVPEVFLALLERDTETADRAVKRLAEVSPAQADVAGTVVKTVLPLLTDDVFWTVGNPQGLLKLLGPLMTLGPKLSAAVGESDLGALTRVMNYPIARGLKSLSVTQVLAGLAAGGAGLPELGDSLPDRYPTAFAYLARGIERMARGELAASLDDYEQALVLPSPVPVRKPVLVNYATALVMAHARPGTMTVEGKPGERLRWVIRELAKMGPVPDDLTTENMVRIAVLNSEAAAAAVLGADVAARKSDNDRVLRVRAMVAYAQHAYLEAFVAAGAALKQDPGHGHMRIIYERSGRELKEWTIGQAGPPKEPVIPPARP